jgi:hypothetical protein
MSDKLKLIARAHLDRLGGNHKPLTKDEVMEIFCLACPLKSRTERAYASRWTRRSLASPRHQ